MFDIGASELLLTVIVAIVVIGPKDLPRALRLAGGWIAKVRRVSGHFRAGVEEMIRQAELEEMEKKWKEKNEAIMRETGAAGPGPDPASAEAALLPPAAPGEPQALLPVQPDLAAPPPAAEADAASPGLPLAPPKVQS